MSHSITRASRWMLLLGIVAGTGCFEPEEWHRWWSQLGDRGSQPTADPRPEPKSAALRGTISPLVTVSGLRLNRVRGYGLVANLVDTGGSDGPEIVRKHLAKEMRRRQPLGAAAIPADEILEDRDTSIVEVTGLIPAIAERGTRFDLAIRAMGEQTRSLAGGHLFLCDLVRFSETPRGIISGKTMATAMGPVFISPFGHDRKAATKMDPRVGVVLGGGTVKEPRKLRLILNTPSYGIARQIQRRLNDRYGTLTPVADAISGSLIDIHVPPKYKRHKEGFLDLILHTTLRSDRTFLEARARALAKEITHPDAAYDAIALAWEALDEQVTLPVVRSFYTHPAPAVSYYAGRTGMHLGDVPGMEVVARHARDSASVFRLQAIEELGWAAYKMFGAGEHLSKLVDDPDVRARIGAYRALRDHDHHTIQSTVLDQDNMILDVVDSSGPFLIYVQRSTAPRIALFGKHMACRPPLLYPDTTETEAPWDALVTLHADPDATELTLQRWNRSNRKISAPLPCPLNVVALIRYLGDTPRPGPDGELMGMGVPYSKIVDILFRLCQSKAIGATFEVERPRVTENLIFRRQRRRPESEY
ncbi:MAG: flagellar basal body P-ring protein FlgI [Phycisphaerae bacterium]